jgi:hypothetical protein
MGWKDSGPNGIRHSQNLSALNSFVHAILVVSKILVSSANKMGRALCSMALGKSLMYTRNNNGPKIEPCGTPCFILVHFETVFELK